jgi:hypothetical protein
MSTIRQHASTAWYFTPMIFGRPGGAVIDALRPVLGDLFEMRGNRLKRQHHLRYGMLDLRVVGHRPAEPERALALDSRQCEIDRPLRDAAVDVAEAQQ